MAPEAPYDNVRYPEGWNLDAYMSDAVLNVMWPARVLGSLKAKHHQPGGRERQRQSFKPALHDVGLDRTRLGRTAHVVWFGVL